MGFIHHHQRQRPADFFFPALAQHQVELLGRRHQNAELGVVLRCHQHPGFNAVDLHRRTDTLHHQAKRLKIAPQLSRHLIHQCPAGRQISHPALAVLKLVQRLQHAELGNQRLAAGGRQADHDRATARPQQAPLGQRAPLRRQYIEQGAVTTPPTHQLVHEPGHARIHSAGHGPQRVFHHLRRGARQQARQ